MLNISSSGTSNAGKKSINEDNFYMNGIYIAENNAANGRIYSDNTQRETQFYAVFDGIGEDIRSDINPNMNFHNGERSSFTGAHMLAALQRHLKEKENYDLNGYVNSFVKKTNFNICEYIRQKGMRTGASFALLCVTGNTAYVYNIGNSKVFLFRENRLTLLSKNDTKAESLVMAKQIGADIARHTSENKILTQHLGIFDNERPLDLHVTKVLLQKNDKFLLCSDGVCNLAGDRIFQLLSRDMSEQEIVTDLMNEASRSEGGENLTAVIVGTSDSNEKLNKAGLLRPQDDSPTHFTPLTFKSKFSLKPKHIRQIIIAAGLIVALIVLLTMVFNWILPLDKDQKENNGGSNNNPTSSEHQNPTPENLGNAGNTGNAVGTTEENTRNIPVNPSAFVTEETTLDPETTTEDILAPTPPPSATTAPTTAPTTSPTTVSTTAPSTAPTTTEQEQLITETTTAATEEPDPAISTIPTVEITTEIITEITTEAPTESTTVSEITTEFTEPEPTETPTPKPIIQEETIAAD